MGPALQRATEKVNQNEDLAHLVSDYRNAYAEYVAMNAGLAIKGIATLGIGTLVYGMLANFDENGARVAREVRRLEGAVREYFTMEEFQAYFPGHIILT